jgi:UDP-glucose 4-epimerase
MEHTNMAKVLVTGGAGYVGGVCCCTLLERGHQVVVADNLSTGHAATVPAEALLYRIDVGDRQAMAELFSEHRFDWIFHFAAKALIPESVSNPGAFFDSNVASGIALLEAAREAKITKFVFSSSAAVYGNPQFTPIEEEHLAEPVNSYGESKLMLERILRWYAEAYDWTVIAFRYFNASGGTASVGEDHWPETHIIPLLLQVAAGQREIFEIFGSDYPTRDGTCVRDYVHVSDIAEAHIRAIENPQLRGMRIYNIGTGNSYSVREVCQAVEEEVGRSLRVKEGSRRAGDPAVLCASPKRLTRELAWQPRIPDLRHIIRTAWQWKMHHPDGYGARPELAVEGRG